MSTELGSATILPPPTSAPDDAPLPDVTEPEQPRLPSLSPSRASDFMTCPLLYRFRVIDRLPERPSPAATRGTVVHAVLERLFDLPAAERVPSRAHEMVVPEWERLLAEEPELATLFTEDEGRDEWLGTARDLLDTYFGLEDPTLLEPAEREMFVE